MIDIIYNLLGDTKLFSLTVAATVAWIILAAFLISLFRRQGRLAEELRQMSDTLNALEKNGNKGEK